MAKIDDYIKTLRPESNNPIWRKPLEYKGVPISWDAEEEIYETYPGDVPEELVEEHSEWSKHQGDSCYCNATPMPPCSVCERGYNCDWVDILEANGYDKYGKPKEKPKPKSDKQSVMDLTRKMFR